MIRMESGVAPYKNLQDGGNVLLSNGFLSIGKPLPELWLKRMSFRWVAAECMLRRC